MELQNLSDDEKMLIARFRLCTEADKAKILERLTNALHQGKAGNGGDCPCEWGE